MTDEKDQWSNIASYLNGHLTGKEKTLFETWISESEVNKATFLEAKKIWESAGVKLQYPEIDSAQLLSDIKSKIANDRPQGRLVSFLNQPLLKVAASISLILVSYFVFRSITNGNVLIESGKEVLTLYLPDSSKVWLNINSRIKYPKKFTTRDVELSGEGFLLVRKNKGTFTVTTGNTITTVVGTAFNLKEQGDSVTLTVDEGIVNFSHSSAVNESVVVKAHEKVVAQKESKLIKIKNDDPSFATWRTSNNPVFEKEKNNPAQFLSNQYSWRKNKINQSVIEGTLINHAGLAAYTKIVLSVTYEKPDGTQANVDLTINGIIYPGKPLAYRRRLLDLLSDTKSVIVKVKSASVVITN
jgi:ferric-dicitrate binding protein FerR (iron transport regulator)